MQTPRAPSYNLDMFLPLTPLRFLHRAASEYGRKTGVVCGEERFTYAEFAGRVHRLTGALRAKGIQQGDRVAFLSFNCHRLLEAYYGVPQAGAILLPLNVRLAPDEQKVILEHSGTRAVFFAPEFLPLVEQLRRTVKNVEWWTPLEPCPEAGDYYDELIAGAEPAPADWTRFDENAVAELFYTSGSTGHAIAGVEMRVVDDRGQEVPRDGSTIGEIVARGDMVMDGYWNEPKATRDVMMGGWLQTGDMAVWDEERYFLIVDRKKDIIISGGENISSIEIEKVLVAHPAVYEAAVVGVPDEKWGEVPKAFVSPKPGANIGEAELRDYVRQHLAGFKVPKSFEFVESLPKGSTGKILKRALREPYWAGRTKRIHG